MQFVRAAFVSLIVALSTFGAQAQPISPDSMPGCVYNATPPVLQNGQQTPWQCDINGKIYANVNTIDGVTISGTPIAGYFPVATSPTAAAWSNTIAAGALANGASALVVTATQPTTPVAAQSGIAWTITSAGSAAQVNRGFILTYAAGYTGSSNTQGANITNSAAGTAKTVIPAAGVGGSSGNMALVGTANGVPASGGGNYGVVGNANAASVNVGLVGLSQGSTNSATNIGVAGSAVNGGSTPVFVGGWFSLNQTTVPTTSAALIGDGNSNGLAAIFVGGGVQMKTLPTSTPGGTPSTVCWDSTAGALWTDASATGPCGIVSAIRFKDLLPREALNLDGLSKLRTDVPWTYKKGRPGIHVGVFADDVAEMDSRCVDYDDEGVTNYDNRCLIAYLVAARNADYAEFDRYRKDHP